MSRSFQNLHNFSFDCRLQSLSQFLDHTLEFTGRECFSLVIMSSYCTHHSILPLTRWTLAAQTPGFSFEVIIFPKSKSCSKTQILSLLNIQFGLNVMSYYNLESSSIRYILKINIMELVHIFLLHLLFLYLPISMFIFQFCIPCTPLDLPCPPSMSV